MIYIVPFDDDTNKPWCEVFNTNSIENVEDKVVDYIINEYDWEDDIKFPSNYHEFIKFCRKEGIFIGKIKEFEEFN